MSTEPSNYVDTAITLEGLVENGTVKSCASLFPVQIWFRDQDGNTGLVGSALRFTLVLEPASEGEGAGEGSGESSADDPTRWIALGWRTSGTGGDPVLVYANRVEGFRQINSAAIIYYNAAGDEFRVKRDSGCACGSRMRAWQPFSAYGGSLAAVQKPSVTGTSA